MSCARSRTVAHVPEGCVDGTRGTVVAGDVGWLLGICHKLTADDCTIFSLSV